MVRHGRVECLSHKLCRTYLTMKWSVLLFYGVSKVKTHIATSFFWCQFNHMSYYKSIDLIVIWNYILRDVIVLCLTTTLRKSILVTEFETLRWDFALVNFCPYLLNYARDFIFGQLKGQGQNRNKEKINPFIHITCNTSCVSVPGEPMVCGCTQSISCCTLSISPCWHCWPPKTSRHTRRSPTILLWIQRKSQEPNLMK